MSKVYHILNGDALRSQIPQQIQGEHIVARFCLVDGPVVGDTLEAIVNTRADFMHWAYQVDPLEYKAKTKALFQKSANFPHGSQVYLWFEEDLFCQVNWWFCMFLLGKYNSNVSLYLVLPSADFRYGFGGMNTKELLAAFTNAQAISPTNVNLLGQLWRAYQNNDFKNLQNFGQQLAANYPFIPAAITAHVQRQEQPGNLGKPKETLLAIMNDLNTKEFGPVFREFWNRLPIYGYGDMQVKRLYDQLLEDNA